MNINLLRTLERIYRHGSVTVAALDLGVTQSAASHALAQLRHVFADPLILSKGGKTELTPLLQSLGPRLGRVMADIEGILREPKRFEPLTTERRFVIGALDYLDLLIIPALHKSLTKRAPAASLVVTRGSGYDQGEGLELGIMEMAMGIDGGTSSHLRSRALFQDEFAVCVDQGHPLAQKRRLTLEDYLSYPHALISTDGRPGGVVDSQLAKLGRTRQIGLTVPSFLTLPLLLKGTSLVLTAPKRVLKVVESQLALKVFTPPLEIPGFTLKLFWHERYHADPGHEWLRQLIYQSAGSK